MLSAVPEGQLRSCVVVGLLQAVMVQILWGRAGLVRLPVIPSPSWVGMERCGGNTRGQSGGRPRRLGVRHESDRARVVSGVLMLPWHDQARSSARMWPSRSP